MRKDKVIIIVLAAALCSIVLAGFFGGCKEKAIAVTSQGEKQPIDSTVPDPVDIKLESPTDKTSEEPQVDKVVVTVNGTKIMQNQIDKRTAPQLALLARNGQAANEEAQNKLRQNILNEIMKEQLVKEAIESEKIEVANYEINNRLSELAGTQNMTIGQLFSQAAKQRITGDQIEEQIRAGIAFDKLLAMQTDSDSLIVSEEDTRKYYDENISQFAQPQRIRASHILFGTGRRDATGKPVEPNETASLEFKTKAEEVAKELSEGGDFEEFVRAHSVCRTKNNGGDLGYFSKDSNMDKDFVEAAFKLNKGDVSDVVQTQFGYHIIKITDKVSATTISFDQAQAAITKWLTNERKKTQVDNYIESLSSKAEIVWAQNE